MIISDSNPEEVSEVKTVYSSDVDARWTIKCGGSYYGYKVHVGTDAKDGFVLSCHATGANVYDGHELRRILYDTSMEADSLVIADKGYSSAANRQMLKGLGLCDGILHKASSCHPLSPGQKFFNRFLSRIRGKVERVFGSWKRGYGFSSLCWFGQS